MNDLSFVLTSDLWDELKKRYDVCIFVGSKDLDKKTGDFSLYFHGGQALCIGLAEVAMAKLLSES